MYSIFKKYIYPLMVIAAAAFVSCTSYDDAPAPNPSGEANEGYIKIFFDMPEYSRPQGSRAMNDAAEKAIIQDQLNILVFKYTDLGGGNIAETFSYRAPVQGAITVGPDNKAMVVVKLVKSGSAAEQYRIVVVANKDLSGVMMTKNTTSKSDVLSQLTFALPGKWNADGANSTPFPMWGESAPVTVSENMPSQNISLFRAVARIDVGLNFVAENGKLTESAAGVNGFKLKEVFVYRTYDAGYAAPLDANFKTVPSVPASASRRADDNPLFFETAAAADSYVREIYVPEASLPASPANGNMHCVVVGGYYEGSTEVSYYRLDFATESAGVRNYMPILRNHRYVFNILQVNGPGFETPDAALNSTPSIVSGAGYDLIVWDETIHEMEVQGKYYFGLDQRDLLFSHPSSSSDPSNVFRIKYQTNYPLSAGGDPLQLSWESASATPKFRAEWVEGSREIAIYAETLNETNTILEDVLVVKAGPFTMRVNVRQTYRNNRYMVNCETVTVSGTYVRGETLGASHFITLTLTAEDRSISGSKYVIETEDPNGYGISFRAEGTFNFPAGQPLTTTVTLAGSGTLNSPEDVESFTLRIVSSSSSGTTCQATIWPVSPLLNVVVLAWDELTYGYAINVPGRGSYKVLDSKNNFGPNDNSIVKTAGFKYVVSTTEYHVALHPTHDAYKWITGTGNNGKIADIVYIAYAASFSEGTANLLRDYMDKGGVVVAYLQDVSSARDLARALFNVGTTISDPHHINHAGSIYPFPAHPKWGLDANQLADTLRKYENDPILNGPFGDVRDKQWGEDRSATACFQSLPAHPALTVYSYGVNINTNSNNVNSDSYAKRISMFKYESEQRNMFWCGDGGFMGSYYGNPRVNNTESPLYWDTGTMFPIPKPTFGHADINHYTQYPVYNSTVFCNVWAWAIGRAEHLRAKREGRQP